MSFSPPNGHPLAALPLIKGDWYIWIYPSSRRNYVKVLAKSMKNKSVGINTDIPAVEVDRFDPDTFLAGDKR
jgi:hypothetical protein